MDWLNFLKAGLGVGQATNASPVRFMDLTSSIPSPQDGLEEADDLMPSWEEWKRNPSSDTAFLWETPTREYVVKLTPHARAKRLKLRMKSRDDIRLTVPPRFSLDALERFLRETESWVAKHQDRMPESSATTLWHFGMQMPYRGALRTIVAASVNDISLTDPTTLYLKLPRDASKSMIQSHVMKLMQLEALRRLTEEVNALRPHLVEMPQALKITNASTRWGSCTWDNVIRISWRLLFLDDSLFQSVVVHECAHLRFKHHQASFWDECVRLQPEHMTLDKALRKVPMKSLPL